MLGHLIVLELALEAKSNLGNIIHLGGLASSMSNSYEMSVKLGNTEQTTATDSSNCCSA